MLAIDAGQAASSERTEGAAAVVSTTGVVTTGRTPVTSCEVSEEMRAPWASFPVAVTERVVLGWVGW